MKASEILEILEELDDELQDKALAWLARSTRRSPRMRPASDEDFIQSQDDSSASFAFTYQASRHEGGWLLGSLGAFYERQWITDVLRMVKGGKEASVYQCASGGSVQAAYIAAKVYRPRRLRNLKNDQLYRLGRDVLDEDGNRICDLGMLKAQRKRSVYGEQVRHQSWIAHEFRALKALHAAGADVPQPYEMGENAILMGYIGDGASAAPTLNTVTLEPEEVEPLYERVLRNVEIMLTNEIVHGDLSAYNILYWNGEITLIDFPQVISPRRHPSAYLIFERDLRRMCEYFTRQGLRTHPARLAADLWTAHGYRLRPEVHPANLSPDRPEDRRLWQEQRENSAGR